MAAGVSIKQMVIISFFFLLVLHIVGVSGLSSSAYSYGWPDNTNHGTAYNNSNTEDLICPTHQCSCFIMKGNRLVRMHCPVTHVSEHLKTMVSQFHSRQTGFLEFTCTYTALDPSDISPLSLLWDGAFKELTSLEGLSFKNCRFENLSRDYFRGLLSLKVLRIQNADIKSIDNALMTHLPRLQELEISGSNVDKLFPLCTSSPLRILNVSNNKLATLRDAGVWCPDRPLQHLEHLDMNYNKITSIPNWLPTAMPNLHHLGFGDNNIASSDKRSFQNLPKLVFLDLSMNSMTYLHPTYFSGINNLAVLGLSGNRLNVLPKDIMSDLTHLRHLDIGDMGLDDEIWLEMAELEELRYLNASHNMLESFNVDIMKRFAKLENLHLSHNRISEFPGNTFLFLVSVQVLDLSHNNIREIPDLAFSNQQSLQYLHLNNNNIVKLGHNVFAKLQDVLQLDLSENQLTFIPRQAFMELKNVTDLNISKNKLSLLDPDLFSKNTKLQFLNISYNRLESIPSMKSLVNLKMTDISHNFVPFLNPALLFSGLKELTHVHMNHNNLTLLPAKLFQGCFNIVHLNLSHNSFSYLEPSVFSSITRVKQIDLSHNNIEDINNLFNTLSRLTNLNLSNNKITKILYGFFPPSIEELNLHSNDINRIAAHTFKTMSKLRKVDLRNNKLKTLTKASVEIQFDLPYEPLFLIQRNPLVCDCNLGWLKDYSDGRLNNNDLPLPDLQLSSMLFCKSSKPGRILQRLPREEFLCNYKTYCEENCACCEYDACYCKYVCPSGCSCYRGDAYLQEHNVLCDSASLNRVPQSLPSGTTLLRLDGNNIFKLRKHSFLALKHVSTLYLNNSQINTIQNHTFKGLKSVRVLYLNDNNISAIFTVTFRGLQHLEELHLENNEIVFIENRAFLSPERLRYVNLQGNSLMEIPVDDLVTFANRSVKVGPLAKLFLSGNAWSCHINFIKRFLKFIVTYSNSVMDVSHIECLTTTTEVEEGGGITRPKTHNLLNFQHYLDKENQTNPANFTGHGENAPNSDIETYALIAACIAVVCTIVLFVIIYINRHLLQVLCFTRFGCRIFKIAKPSDDDRPYDAFISYSNKDEDFVIRQLAPRLENGDKKFRLCLHYRDVTVGACIAETIVRSVEASKRTVLVVSDNYLDSEWCRFEFQTAHQQVLSERCNRVILILMHDIDPQKLDSTLKMYMRARTYLKYDDPWFWEKLMFSMPDVQYRTTKQIEQYQQQQPLHPQHQHLFHQPLCQSSPQELEYLAKTLSHLHPGNYHSPSPSVQGSHCGTGCGNGSVKCEKINTHNDYSQYEIPQLEPQSITYQLANNCSCGVTHTNTAYRHSDCNCSDSTSGYHNGSVGGSSCVHYEEVGPPMWSVHTTPQRQQLLIESTPPPLPSIPKEGLVPKDRLRCMEI